ncbi:MAG: PIN domain-containing protein [Gemmatimonas sp.]|nr:PIN domain-containing protein [Gemmatimonas sp.]
MGGGARGAGSFRADRSAGGRDGNVRRARIASVIVADTSVLISVLTGEAEAAGFTRTLQLSDNTVISAVTLVETTFVAARDGDVAATLGVDRLLSSYEIETVAVDRAQAEIARQAFITYGKGRHPAALNICDCFSYALARALECPLLFKGDDFTRTDVKVADPAANGGDGGV